MVCVVRTINVFGQNIRFLNANGEEETVKEFVHGLDMEYEERKMPTKEMTLCRVKLVWRGEEILNWKNEKILPVRGWTGHVAVSGDPREIHLSEFRQKAAQLALEDVVGPPEYQEKVGAKVVSVKVLGLVRVEEE